MPPVRMDIPPMKGMFTYVDTHGLPLDFVIDILREKGLRVDWVDFIIQAMKVWPFRTVKAKVNEAVIITWGEDSETHELSKKLLKFFEDEIEKMNTPR